MQNPTCSSMRTHIAVQGHMRTLVVGGKEENNDNQYVRIVCAEPHFLLYSLLLCFTLL
jgi:hypothetical protein